MITNRVVQHDDDLTRAILDIIAHYQPIPTINIWFEVGEDDRFREHISLAEVKEILSLLENRKSILREDGDQWAVKERFAEKVGPVPSNGKNSGRKGHQGIMRTREK